MRILFAIQCHSYFHSFQNAIAFPAGHIQNPYLDETHAYSKLLYLLLRSNDLLLILKEISTMTQTFLITWPNVPLRVLRPKLGGH